MSETEKTVEELLAEAAAATSAATPPKAKKEKAPKEPKEPKEKKPAKTYPQANEDGTPALNEDGTPVMGAYATRYKEPKAPKAPKLDADGNPIARQSNVYPPSFVLKLTEGHATFKARAESKRGQMFAALTEGQTVQQYYDANGGKSAAHTFLVWFVNEAKVVELVPAAE